MEHTLLSIFRSIRAAVRFLVFPYQLSYHLAADSAGILRGQLFARRAIQIDTQFAGRFLLQLIQRVRGLRSAGTVFRAQVRHLPFDLWVVWPFAWILDWKNQFIASAISPLRASHARAMRRSAFLSAFSSSARKTSRASSWVIFSVCASASASEIPSASAPD